MYYMLQNIHTMDTTLNILNSKYKPDVWVGLQWMGRRP